MTRNKLDTGFINDSLTTILFLYNRLDIIKKKTILNMVGVSKQEVESLGTDEDLVNNLESIYSEWLNDFDVDNPTIEDSIYNANLYMSGDNVDDFKKQIETYKKL